MLNLGSRLLYLLLLDWQISDSYYLVLSFGMFSFMMNIVSFNVGLVYVSELSSS